MSRAQVVKSLISADFYLDLGDHPGTDRIPREAALLNCIVITNKRGSARNSVDIPIQNEVFKFDDEKEDFEFEILSFLELIRAHTDDYLQLQSDYRASILGGKERFSKEVLELIQVVALNESNSNTKFLSTEDLPKKYIAKLLTERDAANIERDAANIERDAARRDFLEIRNSLSWRATSPFRFIASKCGLFRR
jgi:hypothetical protein